MGGKFMIYVRRNGDYRRIRAGKSFLVTRSIIKNYRKKVRLKASECLRRAPVVKRTIKGILFNLWLARCSLRTRSLNIDPLETTLVDPAKISTFVTVGKDIFGDTGVVLAGEWDQRRRPLEDKAEFEAFNDRFLNNKEWRETRWYGVQTDKIRSGKVRFGCRSQDEFDLRLRGIDGLFKKIQKEGYKSQRELSWDRGNDLCGIDEVTIAVSRDGEPLFVEGRHRLAIAKILNLSSIPVRITVRHKNWYDFRQKVFQYCQENGGKLYSPITHFDLASLPSAHDETRFELVRKSLPLRSGTLLDIGAHFGYFCHRFEETGFDCTAVESDVKIFYFLERLRKAEDRRFRIINKSIFDYDGNFNFDVVLALNIFYHFLRSKDLHDELVRLLGKLRTRFMFFQPHLRSEHEMMKDYAYKTYDEDEFVKFVLNHSCLNQATCLGGDRDGRSLYMLS
jgi:hypothetical protein